MGSRNPRQTTREPAVIGRRLRELRLERGLQQADVARSLGVSPAYLNLMEKGKRTVQLPIMWKALGLFEVEMDVFMASLGERTPPDALVELMDDPLLKSIVSAGGVSSEDLAEFSGEPRRTATLVALFNLYKNTRSQLDQALSQRATARARADDAAPSARLGYSPFDEITDFLQAHKNFFPELEAAATRLRVDHKLGRRILSHELVQILKRRKIKVELGDAARDGVRTSSVVRRFDPKRRTLAITGLHEQPLKFQLAATLGLVVLDDNGLADRLARAFGPKHAETPRLVKIHLANYFAGALFLPYRDFFSEVQRTRYDVELLSSLFEMSYEAVAHRLCNLADPKHRGVPMHFLRCDIAGNISKKYSATGLRFPDGVGSCAKWAVHHAFLTPSVIARQYSQMPDGATYFCFAKVAVQPHEGSVVRGTTYSIGLGTAAEDAHHLIYARDMPYSDPRRMAVPVGVTCRFCERSDCNQRAAPSYKFAFNVDAYTKKDNFFSPLLADEKK